MSSSKPDTASTKLLTLAPDLNLPQSEAVQFFQKLKIAVMAGYWRPDEVLPSTAEFAALLFLSTDDIDAALQALAQEHWIELGPKGYHITPKIDQPVSSLSSLSEMLQARGYTAGSVWLERKLCQPDLNEQCRLHLQSGTLVARLDRLRTAGDYIIGYERTTMPDTFVPEPDKVGDSLYQFMASNDLHIVRASEEIEAYACDEDMAKHCKLAVGHPMLHLTRTGYLSNGRALELTHSYFRSDYYRYLVELSS